MHSNLNTLEMIRVYISGVYISQLIRFAGVSSHVADFSAHNKSLAANFSNRAIGTINFGRLSQNFIIDTMNWFLKFNVGLKPLLHQGLSEPEFYGDFVYKFKKKMKVGLIFLFSSEKLSYVINVLDIT